MGCRYHYNVADDRLAQHIDKGNEDGLFISSVACCSSLWALIMDAGTGFSDQVYKLSPCFLHKVSYLLLNVINLEAYLINLCCGYPHLLCYVCLTGSDMGQLLLIRSLVNPLSSVWVQEWIMEQWETNYYISALAGSSNGSSLVVMSKG